MSADTIDEIWEYVVVRDDEKLAIVSAQCVANVAAAGNRDLVWQRICCRLIDALETNLEKVRAAVIACVQNCVCHSSSRALEVAKNTKLMEAIFARTDQGESSSEWAYLLACSLFRLGAASTAFLSTSSTCRESLFSYALTGINSEGDRIYCEHDDVALVALQFAASNEIALEIVADASGLGPEQRAPALRAAGAFGVAGEAILDDALSLSALKIVANICHLDAEARNLARPLIPDVLNRCKVDPKLPLQREWAVFAVRNMCQDNDSNREYIASLKAQAVATPTEDLNNLGIDRIDLSEDTGKVSSVTLRR